MNATIPTYAHSIPVSADGIKFRKVHGPSTKAAAERRANAGRAYLAAIAEQTKRPGFTEAHLRTAR